MATNFPTSLDALTNPTSTDALTSPSHADQHANSNDAIEALQAKVGVNSSAVTTSLDYKVGLISGRNSVINGDFKVWQRGTSVAIGTNTYLADRWGMNRGSYAAGASASRQATSDTTNLPNIQYCIRAQRDSGNTSTEAIYVWQAFESVNVKRFLGKTVTMSFYARVGANYSAASSNLNAILYGSTNATDTGLNSATGITALGNRFSSITTTWVRYSFTATVSTSITQLFVTFSFTPVGTAGVNDYFEITGLQVEAGAVATPFEFEQISETLAKCQRYYQRITPGAVSLLFGNGSNQSTINNRVLIPFPTTMRIAPTSLETSGTANQYSIAQAGIGVTTASVVPVFANSNTNCITVSGTVASGLTQFNPSAINTDATNGATAYLGWSAEL